MSASAQLGEPTAPPEEVRRDAQQITDELLGGDRAGEGGGGGTGGDTGGAEVNLPQFDVPEPTGMGAIGQALVWVVLVALAVLVIWLVVRLIMTWRPSLRRRRKRDGEPETVIEEEDLPVDAGEALSEAELAEADGDWRRGLLLRMRAVVASLAEQGHLEEVAGLTVSELAGQLSVTRPEAEAPFRAAGELFERSWYGNLPTGPAERDRFVAAAEQIDRRVPA